MKRTVMPLVAAAALVFSISANAIAQDEVKKDELTVAKPVAKAVPDAKVRPLSATVSLVSDTEIAGTLDSDTSTLELQSSFGTIQVPLTEVAGIRFASADDASTTIVMLNGDSITGATDVKDIKVETTWGSATINGPNISSILFVPGLVWSATEGVNGKRWQLISSAKSKAPAVTPAAVRRPTVNTPVRPSMTLPAPPVFRSR